MPANRLKSTLHTIESIKGMKLDFRTGAISFADQRSGGKAHALASGRSKGSVRDQ